MNNSSSGAGSVSGEEAGGRDMSNLLEMGYSLGFFGLGFPINVWALARHLKLFRNRSFRHRQEGRLARLSVNLIVGNLLVLIHCLSKTIWLWTFDWRGGELLCRLLAYNSNFAFYLCSNMVGAIAVDMFWCVRRPLKAQINADLIIRRLVCGAWVLAAVCAAPIPALKGLVTIPSGPFQGRSQCYMLLYDHPLMPVINLVLGALHPILVFYVPLGIIVVCYVAISTSIRQRLNERKSITAGSLGGMSRKSSESTAMLPRHPSSAGPGPGPGAGQRVAFTLSVDPSAVRRESLAADGEALLGSREGTRSKEARMRHSLMRRALSQDAPPSAGGIKAALSRHSDISLRHLTRTFRRSSTEGGSLDGSGRKRHSQGYGVKRRLLRISIAIIMTYVVTWLPYQVLAVWRFTCEVRGTMYGEHGCSTVLAKLEWLEALMLLSTCINPFLYRFKVRGDRNGGNTSSSGGGGFSTASQAGLPTKSTRLASAHHPRVKSLQMTSDFG